MVAVVLARPAEGAEPKVAWAVPVGETDADEDEIDGVAVDGDGNTTITGVFRNQVRFGTETMTSAGQGDIFLASYTSEGELRWARQFGSTGEDNAFDLKVDGAGNTVASGWFAGKVDFGGTVLESAGGNDAFLAKFDPRGRTIWARSFGGAADDGGNELDVLPDGAIATSVTSGGDLPIDGHTYEFGGGIRDSYAIRLTRRGEVRWVHPFNGPGAERIRAMAIAPTGEVYVGLQYQGVVSSGGTTLASAGGPDGAAAKLAPDGEPRWILPVGGAGDDNVRGLGVTPDGTIYASGLFTGAATIFNRTEPGSPGGGADYIAQLDPDGSIRWLVTGESNSAGTGGEIRTADTGPLLATYLPAPLTLLRDGMPVGTVAPPGQQPTALLATFEPDGTLASSYSPTPVGAASRANGSLPSISPDRRFTAFVIRFRGTIDVDGTEMTTPAVAGPDSALILFRNGPPQASIARVRPRGVVRVRPGKPGTIRARVRNRGEAIATDLRLCPQRTGRATRSLRRTKCERLDALESGAAASFRFRIRPKGPQGGHRRARLTLRLRTGNGPGDRTAVRIEVDGRRR